jgi:predicted metal-dependent phosphoesterase TrpH
MHIKTNFHFHTNDDPRDPVGYTVEEGIDHAAMHGFGALAVTCHQKFAWTKNAASYAESRGILLIPGIEVNVDETSQTWGRHVLILNAVKDAEEVRTFKELAEYKSAHPESFIIAPHPYFYGDFSLHEYLEKYVHLFDAIEHSWFYSRFFNRNIKARAIAKKHHLPFISTSDTHFLDFFHINYCTVDSPEAASEAIFEAIRNGRFENTTSPRSFSKDMIWKQGKFFAKTYIKRGKKGLERG